MFLFKEHILYIQILNALNVCFFFFSRTNLPYEIHHYLLIYNKLSAWDRTFPGEKSSTPKEAETAGHIMMAAEWGKTQICHLKETRCRAIKVDPLPWEPTTLIFRDYRL